MTDTNGAKTRKIGMWSGPRGREALARSAASNSAVMLSATKWSRNISNRCLSSKATHLRPILHERGKVANFSPLSKTTSSTYPVRLGDLSTPLRSAQDDNAFGRGTRHDGALPATSA